MRKIELWYVGDIGAVVNTTIMLHNMMVAQQIDNDEYECESFYAFGNLEAEERQCDCNNEQEQRDVDRRMAEIALHRRLYETTDAGRHTLTDQQKAVLDSTPRGGGTRGSAAILDTGLQPVQSQYLVQVFVCHIIAFHHKVAWAWRHA